LHKNLKRSAKNFGPSVSGFETRVSRTLGFESHLNLRLYKLRQYSWVSRSLSRVCRYW